MNPQPSLGRVKKIQRPAIKASWICTESHQERLLSNKRFAAPHWQHHPADLAGIFHQSLAQASGGSINTGTILGGLSNIVGQNDKHIWMPFK